MGDAEGNPFTALFSSSIEGIAESMDETLSPEIGSDITVDNSHTEIAKIDTMVRRVFSITINAEAIPAKAKRKDYPNQLVFLEELSQSVSPETRIDLDTLEQALFERLLLYDPAACVLPKNGGAIDKNVVIHEVITYLFLAEQNLSFYCNSIDECEISVVKKMKQLILRNAVTALKQPELFEKQNLPDQLLNLTKMYDQTCYNFIYEIVKEITSDDPGDALDQLRDIFKPVLKLIDEDIQKASLATLDLYIFPALQLFTGNLHLAEILLELCKPVKNDVGLTYQKTLLGGLLSLSTLPGNHSGQFEYFVSPLDKAPCDIEERNLWTAFEHLISNLHKMFLALLKCNAKTKTMLLKWIADCIYANLSKGKIWASQSSSSALLCASDGFMLNLGYVLVMLCQPFCSSPNNSKCLKIDPTYCAVEEADRDAKCVHMKDLSKETCIIPPREVYEDVDGVTRPTAGTYNFVTECFFMTHKVLDLGYRVVAEKLTKISQELSHFRQTFAEALTDPSSELANVLDRRIKHLMTRLLSMRCAIREPQCMSLLANLHSASCHWLVQVAVHKGEHDATTDSYAPLSDLELKFPINEEEPDTLRCVPEFIVENIVGYLSSVKYFSPTTVGERGIDLLEPILSLVLVFMGSAEKMRNPHLRARLAECLATMLPNQQDDDVAVSSMSSFFREKIFKEHPHRLQIVPSLLHVFVGIEVTGQSVQFEQKFNYRRPMYLIMEYLWEIEEHRNIFKRLSEEAEASMEAVTPPIFLRFVNLLMNDAVFLLDEALNNMAQIRTMQSTSDDAVARLSIQEREEHYNNLRYTGMIARFDNILGKHTIRTLEHLTSEIKSVFCHPTMLDRIASMLNYFLLHLVGPNKKNFKVKDSKEYEFDPVTTVLNICRIYIHLGDNDNFCLAVSQDGRSYSPQLFKFAEDVLVRIRGGELVSSLQTVAQRVSELAQRQLKDDEVLGDAPDEFLDPIMNTIMYDPVILPSSKITIDRTTIARHLLSDQSDPFNRSPLSMDQVKSDVELKNKIVKWIEQKRKDHPN
ncbi:ubiquitination factor E4A [Arctopsyche grandis]|uniref:ubiquitination factor E4A n=1 Tax=Arctopsyche grandis TaxID=121162 RepID=UPI00406D7EA9